MTKLIKLNETHEKDEFLNKLKNKKLMIYEDVQGSRIFVKWNGDRFIIKPKSTRNEELNFVDLAVQKFYNLAYFYFHSLPDYVTNLLSKNWWFCFEYFPDKQPAHIEYNRLPKNNMILSCIVKGSKYTYNLDELFEYAKLFDVEPIPVIFNGKLNNKQLEIINLFLNTSEDDLEYIFGEDNFAYFFYKILNPNKENSFLMDKGVFNDNLEKIMIKIDGNYKYTFELLNPMYQKMNLNNNTEFVQIYSLILVNFMEYCQLNGIEHYKPKNITKDKLYVDLICEIFNDYMNQVKDELIEWDFIIPSFFKDDKFKINYNLLRNKETVEHIKSNPKIEYIFKVILNSFNKFKKKPIGVFTEENIKIFNTLVEKIDIHLDQLLKINREYKLRKKDLLNFNDFFDLNYNIDTTGRIYIDDDKFGDEEKADFDKKKKGKKGKIIPNDYKDKK